MSNTLAKMLVAGTIGLASCASIQSLTQPAKENPAPVQTMDKPASSANLESKVVVQPIISKKAESQADPRTTVKGNPIYSLETVTILGNNYNILKMPEDQLGKDYTIAFFRQDMEIGRFLSDEINGEIKTQRNIVSGEGGMYFLRPHEKDGQKVDYIKFRKIPEIDKLNSEQKKKVFKVESRNSPDKERGLPYFEIPHLGLNYVASIDPKRAEQLKVYPFYLVPFKNAEIVDDPQRDYFLLGRQNIYELKFESWDDIKKLREAYTGESVKPQEDFNQSGLDVIEEIIVPKN